MADPVSALERAVQQTATIVEGIEASQWGVATPCTDWDVRALVNHATGALVMMRTVIDEGNCDAGAIFTADLLGSDPVASYRREGASAVEAFARPGVLDGPLKLPFGEFPAAFAIGLVTFDQVVHGWDMAKATGQAAAFDPELTAVARGVAEAFGAPEARGTDFGPAVEAPAGASDIDQLAAFTGRTA